MNIEEQLQDSINSIDYNIIDNNYKNLTKNKKFCFNCGEDGHLSQTCININNNLKKQRKRF